MELKLKGTAKAVFNYLAILADTKVDKHSPGWLSLRARIIAEDKDRDPQYVAVERLSWRVN